ncbi:hypothetical protein DVR12_17765 [Chitinophaga silvatica]|uniref:Tissue inhibitor of metalloproteinase n=1 Tax=Chitinophaga silvatica TaxID=2282649 RepID=A0A3E1Y7U3_9BACT|nr:hypothetical protein [Chitinophaga silvatica]RFS21181.1 hypothetical protein DVR12_17765 [Chitinophaga silvatica]
MKYLCATVLLILFTLKSFCCSCIGFNSVESGLKNSDVVFVGKVLSKEIIDLSDPLYPQMLFQQVKLKFLVTKAYKGKVKSDTLTVITGMGKGDCGYPFEMNKNYIVYSSYYRNVDKRRKKDKRFLSTDICQRTRSSDDKDEIIALENS